MKLNMSNAASLAQLDPVARQIDAALAAEGHKVVLTRREAAGILKIHPDSLWVWLNQRKIPSSRVGNGAGRYRITRADIARYLANSQLN